MKKILLILISFFRSKKKREDNVDEKMWEHLDGAEFFVVPPQARTSTQLD